LYKKNYCYEVLCDFHSAIVSKVCWRYMDNITCKFCLLGELLCKQVVTLIPIKHLKKRCSLYKLMVRTWFIGDNQAEKYSEDHTPNDIGENETIYLHSQVSCSWNSWSASINEFVSAFYKFPKYHKILRSDEDSFTDLTLPLTTEYDITIRTRTW